MFVVAWDQLSDDIVIDSATEAYVLFHDIAPEELSASQELAERVLGMAYCEVRTAEAIYKAGDEIAEKYELPYGLAMPSFNSGGDLGMAELAPGTALSHASQREGTEYAQRLAKIEKHVRNSWEMLGDRSVAVVETDEGPMALCAYHAGSRLRKFMESLMARMDSPMSEEAELKALDLLKTKITHAQFRCYVLNGSFVEHSDKSDLYYFFRKGLPILAVSYHDDTRDGKVLACLCCHPYGYYRFTYAGVMCPTDEVIGQLLLMRASEKKLWAKSGQWNAWDPRSGL